MRVEKRSVVFALKFLVISILFFFCVNHFDGFRQDGILYALQCMNRLEPGRFLNDPAFMFGNQDAFSVFSLIYSVFLKCLPIDLGTFTFCFLIQTFVAASACWMLFRWCAKSHLMHLSLLMTLLFLTLFSYGEERTELFVSIKTLEAFPVARSLAVGFGFLGFAFLFDKKKISLLLFLIGSWIHPLTVGWCLPFWGFFWFPKMRMPVVALSLFIPLTILVGREPFAPFPKDWLDLSFDTDHLSDVVSNLFLYVLFFAVSLKQKLGKKWKRTVSSFLPVLCVAVYWLVVSVVLRHIFLFQVQTFRIEWICHVFALALQVCVGFRLFVSKVRRLQKWNLWEVLFVAVSLAILILCGACRSVDFFVCTCFCVEKNGREWFGLL